MRNSTLALAIAVGLSTIGGSSAFATTYYFDTNGSTTGSGITTGGSYLWEDANWTTDATGASATVNYPDATPGNFPEFAAGADAGTTANYTVTANSNHNVAGMYMANLTTPSVVTGGATLTLGGTGVFTITGTTPQGFIVGSSTQNFVIKSKLSGTGGVTNSATGGSLYLYGNNDYSGGTTLASAAGVNFNNANSFGTGPITISTSTGILANPDVATAMSFSNPVTGRTTAGTFVLASAAPITFTGGWTIGNGVTSTFSIGNTALPNTTMTIASNLVGKARPTSPRRERES